jgi:glycine betaine catabolism B
MNFIDSFLNRFTMYVVVLYGLLILAGVSLIYSLFGLVFYSPVSLISSLLILLVSCVISNAIFAKLFKAPVNRESSAITALILFFIMMPIMKPTDAWVFVFAGIAAMGSKYVLAINKRHIFNPAAFALLVIGLLALPNINWWVGNSYLFPVVLIIGLLIVRKVRKLVMFSFYYVVGIITIGFFAFINNRQVFEVVPEAILSYPILFLGTVLLPEPITMPPKRKTQLVYGGIVGILQGAQYQLGPIYSTPELGIIIGNIYSYLVSFKQRLVLILKEKKQLSPTVYEFVFSNNRKFKFDAGQYFEWTLPHKRADLRSVRRYFTIASAPSENDIRLGVKIDPANSSTYKKALITLNPGDKIYAGQLAGDFILPKKNDKYILMAGGIGVTPFRSIIKDLVDKKEKADIVLFYSSSDEKDFVYKDIFDSAKEFGVKTIYVCSRPSAAWKGKSGRIDAKMIKEEVPDFSERIYYLSGPNAMVEAYKKVLKSLGIKPNKIITDYFPGF